MIKFISPGKMIACVTIVAGIVIGISTISKPRAATLIDDPKERAAAPAGMVYVPAGPFLMGTDDSDADEEVRPQRNVDLPAFYMDRTEVTNREFRKFKKSHEYPAGEDEMPATAVTYAEAEGYAKFVGKAIPTAEQWEKAARGTDGRRYPWGNEWDKAKVASRARRKLDLDYAEHAKKVSNACYIAASRVQRVGSVPIGASPYGCLDMAGNAWEWVQGYFLGNEKQRILRGGAVSYTERACRSYGQAVEGWESTCNDTGFRCAKSVASIR